MSPASRIVGETIPGPAGALEASVRIPHDPRGVAVLAHPHPQHGGTMHTKVVHRASRLLADRLRLRAVRFNYRGVGASHGSYGEGSGETEDLVAAVRFARGPSPASPLLLGGFSFGSVRALEAVPRVGADILFLMGVPLLRFEGRFELPPTDAPVVWIQGERDEFGPGALVREVVLRQGLSGNLVRVVPGADHFFTGALDAFEEAAVEILAPLLATAAR